MNLKHKDSTASILEFLRIEKKCYDEVLSLMKEQIQAIEQEDEKSLDAVVEKKSGILQTARTNETRLEKFVTELSENELAKAGKQAGELKTGIETVLAKIIEIENNCQAELKARKFLPGLCRHCKSTRYAKTIFDAALSDTWRKAGS